MGIRFSKSIKLGNLVKLNISKSGVSATIGKKGASINLGSKGTYLNLSPTVAGITGTGLSYRQKITGGYGSLLNKLTGQSNDKVKPESKNSNEDKTNQNSINDVDIDKVVEEYENNLIASINVHKLADKVITKEEYNNKVNSETNESLKSIYELSKNGDEDTIETLVGSFMANLDFAYPINANYELEEHILYVDLDLPEIEQLSQEYPTIVKEKLTNKKKSNSQLKQEYAYTVMSLSAYLAASMFNLSSYIEKIVISGFTTIRNTKGDLSDEYLYSIKYNRESFENKLLSDVDDIYNFILSFENRINLNVTNYSFKKIEPFEMDSVAESNNAIDEAVAGLKQLGYKVASINSILPKLKEMNLQSSSEYLKQALKMLSEEK